VRGHMTKKSGSHPLNGHVRWEAGSLVDWSDVNVVRSITMSDNASSCVDRGSHPYRTKRRRRDRHWSKKGVRKEVN